jgi:hypothetical protein
LETQILLIIKSRGEKSGEMKLDIQWLIHCQDNVILGWVVCWLFESEQRGRDDDETRGNHPDEEGGQEVVPFGNCPEAEQHLHILGQVTV